MNLSRKDHLTLEKSHSLVADRYKKTVLNLGKILISLALLYLVFRKIPFSEVAKIWQKTNFLYLILGALFFLFSQIISAKRLQNYFETAGFPISYRSNLKLYFLGMFYNFFIPGGIGGDAYKVYLLNKKFGWSVKKLTFVLFKDRLIGLISILLIICILTVFILPKFSIYLVILFFAGIFCGYFLTSKLFISFKRNYWQGLVFSFAVQISQIFCFIFLLKSIGVTDGFTGYSLLFLASSVLSLVSFAGIGIREMMFLQASKYFDFSPQFSVSASLLFTVITAFFSLFGLYFQLRKLHLELSE